MNEEHDGGLFVMIPYLLFKDGRVSRGAKDLFGLIIMYSCKEGYCQASNEYLADEMRTTARQVRAYLQELETNGYIMREITNEDRKIYAKYGGREAPQGGEEENFLGGGKKLPRGEEENFHPEHHHASINPYTYSYPYPYPYTSKNTNNQKEEEICLLKETKEEKDFAPSSEGAPPLSMFDEFWKSYPRKEDKKKAKALFLKIPNLEEEFPRIMKGLDRDKKSKQWNEGDGKFIPYPSTWLNRERWKDEGTIRTNKQEFDDIIDPEGNFGGIVDHVFR